MSLIAPSYPDPQDPATPIVGACGWIYAVHTNFENGRCWIEIAIHRSAAAADIVPVVQPAARLALQVGDVLVPAEGETPAITVPPLAAIDAMATAYLAANPGRSCLEAFRAVLYPIIAQHPNFAGSVQG